MAESLSALVKRVNALTVRTTGVEGRVAALEAAPAPIPVPPPPVPVPVPVPVPTPTPVPVPVPSGEFVTYPSPEVAFICGPQLRSGSALNLWKWFDTNASAKGHEHGMAFPATLGAGDPDSYINFQYYDQGLVQYINYHRTGDPAFLTYARKIADSWWASPWINGGNTLVENSLAPRNVSLGGLILRALDGRPEFWPWITKYVREMQYWLPVASPVLHLGVRDGGYILLETARLAATHPEASVRAEMLERAHRVSVDYYARLQHANGGYFWVDGGEPWEQPFQVGLMLEGQTATHRLTGDATIRASILRSVDQLWSTYRTGAVPERPDLRWRAVPYFAYPDGRTDGETNLAGGTDLNTIRDGRQRNSLVLHAFGYAYQLTKDAKYRTWGDEIFAATYGKGQGPGADEMYGLADFRAKEHNQAYRTAGRYLALRL